jgi:hypothetical protein
VDARSWQHESGSNNRNSDHKNSSKSTTEVIADPTTEATTTTMETKETALEAALFRSKTSFQG